MAAQWFVQVDGQPSGPLTPPQLKRWVDEGRVKRETLVRLGTDGKWVPASRVKGLLPTEAPSSAAPKSERPADATPTTAGKVEPARGAAPESSDEASGSSTGVEATGPVATAAPERGEPSRVAKDLGLGAMILGLAGLAAFWLPFLGLPMAGLGVLLGLVGVVVAIVVRGSGLWLSVAGTCVAAAILGAGTFWAMRPEAEAEERPVVAASDPESQREAMFEAEAEYAQFQPQAQWANASRPLRRGNVEVEIVEAKVDFVDLNDLGVSHPSDDKLLQIRLAVRNKGSRSVRYESWSGAGRVRDDHVAILRGVEGRVVERHRPQSGVNIEGQLSLHDLAPDEEVVDLLVFEVPRTLPEEWKLELPAAAVGGRTDFNFLMPADMVR